MREIIYSCDNCKKEIFREKALCGWEITKFKTVNIFSGIECCDACTDAFLKKMFPKKLKKR